MSKAHDKALNNAKDGFDSKKRWGNSAIKGVGVNSPAMMAARSKTKAKEVKPKNIWKGADMKNDKSDYYGPHPGHLKK